MTQILIKVLLAIVYIAINVCFSFYLLRIIFTKEIDIRYPINWIKNKAESYIPTTTKGITISPETIALSANEWQGVSSFNVYNNTLEPFYDIYLKLEIEGLGIRSEDVEVTPKNISDFMAVQIIDVSVNFYILQIKGTDSKGKECIYLILYNLLPHESQPFKIDLKRTADSNIKQLNVIIKLIKSSRDPVQILYQDNKAAYPFKLTENINVKQTSIFIKRNK